MHKKLKQSQKLMRYLQEVVVKQYDEEMSDVELLLE